MFGLGSVIGFFVGNIDLPRALPWLGRTQLEVVSVVACVVLIGTHAGTSFGVEERVLLKSSGR